MTSRSRFNRSFQQGWLLVGLIVLVSAVILALVGITFYLTEHLRTTSLRQNQTRAVYLAQAGVMQAIYDFRFDGPGGGSDNCFTLGEYNALTGASGSFPNNDVFILGGKAADVLMANMIPAMLDTGNLTGQGTRDRLRNWSVQNVLCALPAGFGMRIDYMTVSWQNASVPAGQGVIRIEIPAGTKIWPTTGGANAVSSPQPSGTRLNIIDTTIGVNQTRSGVIWFATNGVMTNASNKLPIDVTFEMSDHDSVTPAPVGSANWSLRIGRYTAPPASGPYSGRSGSFTVKVVGEVRRGAFPFTTLWRRLQAEYRLNDADTATNRQEVGAIRSDPSPGASRPGYREITWRTP